MPAVVGAGKQRVIMGNRIPPLHVVVHMGERPRHLVVVVPIGHDGDEGLRRLVVREVVAALHPELRRIVGVGSPPVGHAHVLWRVVYPPVPPVGGHPQEHFVRIHNLYGVIIDRKNRSLPDSSAPYLPQVPLLLHCPHWKEWTH